MAIDSDVPEVVKTFLVCKKMSGRAEGTLANYLYVCRLFFRHVRKLPEDVTTNDIRVFLYQYQQYHKISPYTLDKYREILYRFFDWAYRETYISSNPAKNVDPIKYQRKTRKPLTQVDLEYLRRACERPRDIAILETFYSTGCRLSELCNIKLSDIDWENKTVYLFGKGQKYRYSFLNAKAQVAIKEYLELRESPTDYLFVSIRYPHGELSAAGVQKIIREIANAATKVKTKTTPHVFRHTTATEALKNGMPIEDIRKLLGHERLDTTMIYAKTSIEDVHHSHERYVL